MNKKQLFINISANITGFLINFAISFFLSPYIINTIGREAYGFFSLGNQFVAYASILSTALNSMASRFITIKIHRNDDIGRDKYFSSVVISNIVLTLVLLIPCALVVLFLDKLLTVPSVIIGDVKSLWAFLFVNFFIGLLMNAFSVATFATNKLYLNSLRNAESGILKAVILVFMFMIFKPSIWYLGFAAVICTLYASFFNVHYTKKLLPDIRCKWKYFDFACTKELLFSGMWNSFTQLAGILNNGLDLLISNIFVSASAMGTLSVSRLIPTYLAQVMSLISSTFVPSITKNFAHDDKKNMVENIEFGRNILSVITGTAVAVLIVFGDIFFGLWVPNENAINLHLISTISIVMYIFIGSITPLNDAIMVANKQKFVAVTYFIAGVLNLIIVFPLLHLIENGTVVFRDIETETAKLITISGISSLIAIVRNAVFTPLYAAYCLKVKWYTFYPGMIRSIIGTIFTIILAVFFRHIYTATNWTGLAISVIAVGILGLAANALSLFSRNQIKELFVSFTKFLKK